MTDGIISEASTAVPVAKGPPGKVSLEVPGWVRRGGTYSWLLIGVLIGLGALIMVIAATRGITVPLAIGVFVSIVVVPIVNWLEKHGIKRALGSGLVLLGFIVVIAGTGLITAQALGSQSEVLKETLSAAVDEVRTWAEDRSISGSAVDEVAASTSAAVPVVRDGVATAIAGIVDTTAGFIAGLILATTVVYYLLKDGPLLARTWVDSKTDRADRDATERIILKSIQDVQRYFRGKTTLALVNGIAIVIGMYFLGVPGALAVGVVNVIGAYIPYIGAFLGGGFAVLMALGEGGLGLALAAFALVLVVQLVLENVLEPTLLGSSLNLHPLTVLLATTLGGMIAGIVGFWPLPLLRSFSTSRRNWRRLASSMTTTDRPSECTQPLEPDPGMPACDRAGPPPARQGVGPASAPDHEGCEPDCAHSCDRLSAQSAIDEAPLGSGRGTNGT